MFPGICLIEIIQNFVNNNFQNLIFFCDKLYQNKRNYKMSLISLAEKTFDIHSCQQLFEDLYRKGHIKESTSKKYIKIRLLNI